MRLKLDKKGLKALEAEVDVDDYADSVANEARLIAPVGTPARDPHPGAYKASIRAEGNNVIAGNRKVFYAWMLEFGTVDTPIFATLRRASRIAGLRVVENRKAQAKELKRRATRELQRDQG